MSEEKVRKMELVESGSLTSDLTTKLQSPKQYGTGLKPNIYIAGSGGRSIHP